VLQHTKVNSFWISY